MALYPLREKFSIIIDGKNEPAYQEFQLVSQPVATYIYTPPVTGVGVIDTGGTGDGTGDSTGWTGTGDGTGDGTGVIDTGGTGGTGVIDTGDGTGTYIEHDDNDADEDDDDDATTGCTGEGQTGDSPTGCDPDDGPD